MNLLITGGTGTLGYALVESILQSDTLQRICIYSRDDHKHDRMREYFESKPGSDKLRFLIGDVRDKDRLKLALRGINLVVHAAAMKIVPLAEYNPSECIKTIVDGTKNLIECVVELTNPYDRPVYKPKVLGVSTDKAVHPINLYGAAKLCAEKLILNANNIMGLNGPIFSLVRYGNVANSRGSVIEKYQELIKARCPLKITDPSMTRFWITQDEAVNLVKFALDYMRGNEIFIPDMPAFNILDLAHTMLEQAGQTPAIETIGIRPGEKLHEEIITEYERRKALYNAEKKAYITSDWYQHQEYFTEGVFSNSPDVKLLTKADLCAKLGEIGVIQHESSERVPNREGL